MTYDARTQRMRCYACKPVGTPQARTATATASVFTASVATEPVKTGPLSSKGHGRARAVAKQGTLPFCPQSRPRAVAVKEEVVEREVDQHLAREGYKFLNTTVRYPYFSTTCPRCQCSHRARYNGGTGQDKGIPDRLLYSPQWTHPSLGVSLWLGVELKGSKTPFSSHEQAKLAHEKHIVVAREWKTAVEAAQRVDAFWRSVEEKVKDD